MRFRKTLSRSIINEDFENLEAFFDAVKKEFKRDYTVRTSGIPGGGGEIALETKDRRPFTPDVVYVSLETDPTNIKDFSKCIELHLNFNYDLKTENQMLKKLRGIIDDISFRLTDCLEQI